VKPENRIVANILTALRRRGIYARRIHGTGWQQPGLPDVICCVAGMLVGLEVKTETGRLSKIQEREIGLIRKAGGVAGVVRSVAEALAIVEDVEARWGCSSRVSGRMERR
jgi:Holliday junction resolvase